MLGLRGSDLLAVRLPPGPDWLGVLAEAWSAGAAVLPVDDRLPDGQVDALLGRSRPTAVLDASGITRRDDGVPVEDGVRLVMATSGTSGEPKLVELTESAVNAGLDASAKRIGSAAGDPWVCCIPVAHMGGMLVLLRGVVQGARVEVHPAFDVDRFAEASRGGARFVSLVPTALRRVLDAGIDLSGYGAILVGGARTGAALLDRARAAGAPVVRTYGMTETCGGCVYDGMSLEGTEMRIEPDSGGGSNHDGLDGAILLRTPSLMRGYRFDGAGTAEAIDADGWYRTRDVGAIRDGRLRVRGRADDVIVTGGEKVWPSSVEDAIRELPDVADVVVTGRPDPDWGERVVAVVVATDPQAPPSLDGIRAHVSAELSPYAAPKELQVVDEISRTALGKPVRG
jgi:O-succinylbenzoic acid--CoA ligase